MCIVYIYENELGILVVIGDIKIEKFILSDFEKEFYFVCMGIR